ncbi:Retrovirus-related Pol polyprotein from transposon RE1 [Bienertia sinuspersici]
MLVSWILRAVDPKLATTIPYFEEAKKIWDYLEKRYCISSGRRLQQLRAAITGCQQTKAMSVEDYYTKLMGLFDDLARLKPPHGYECGKCTCQVAEKYALDKEEEILHQFFIGIDDVFMRLFELIYCLNNPLLLWREHITCFFKRNVLVWSCPRRKPLPLHSPR